MPDNKLHLDLTKKVPNLTISPWMIPIFQVLMRFMTPKGSMPDSVETSIIHLDGIEMRLHTPKDKEYSSMLLWIHGGGLIIGDPSQDDTKCAKFVEEMGVAVIAIRYRLAPKYPFPAAIDDCYAVWCAVQKHAPDMGIDPNRIAIGGASAGGGLAANLALRIRDDGGIQPAAQLLVYPMLDDRTTLRTDVGLKEHMVWNNKSNTTGWGSYLGKLRGADEVPPYAVAARHTDLQSLPPTWIGIGTLDLFFDENVEYYNRLKEAGVSIEFEQIEGAYHGFDGMDPEATISKAFDSKMVEFLRPLM